MVLYFFLAATMEEQSQNWTSMDAAEDCEEDDEEQKAEGKESPPHFSITIHGDCSCVVELGD